MKMDGGRHSFTVRWHPFQLRPNTPVEGIPKPPNTPENPRAGPRLKAAGAAVGIDFTGLTDRVPNTFLSHVLLDYALESGGPSVQDRLSERLFKAYFTDGIFPDAPALSRLAAEVGMDPTASSAALSDQRRHASVQQKIRDGSRLVSGGVPTFYFNGKFAFSGAQDERAFLQAFNSD